MPNDTFVHLTDFHFWEVVVNPFRLLNKRMLGNLNVVYKRRHEFDVSRVSDYLEHLHATGIQTVLLTGDFTSTGTRREFAAAAKMAQWLDDKGHDVIAIPGNHDVYTKGVIRRRIFERHFDAWFPEEGLPAKRTLPGGTDLILVPTVTPDFQSRGRITDVELEGLREYLRTANEPLVVAGHYPYLHETYAYRAGPSRRLRNAEALRKTLAESGKRILYVAGHVHRFSYIDDPEHANLSHLTTGAFFRTAGESEAAGDFTAIRVDAQGFHVTRHIHQETWQRRTEPPPNQ